MQICIDFFAILQPLCGVIYSFFFFFFFTSKAMELNSGLLAPSNLFNTFSLSMATSWLSSRLSSNQVKERM